MNRDNMESGMSCAVMALTGFILLVSLGATGTILYLCYRVLIEQGWI